MRLARLRKRDPLRALIASPAGSLSRFLGCRAFAAGADRRAGIVRLAPVARLASALELHRLDVGSGDDEVAFDEPHRERGHSPALSPSSPASHIIQEWNFSSAAVRGRSKTLAFVWARMMASSAASFADRMGRSLF
jgi:hypothetical protein